jgi:peptide/nickel transport system ATP-binding protein
MTSTISAPLEARSLTKWFPANGGVFGNRSYIHAVDDVTFALRPGTITALVGESGSGKSTVARLLARLYEPTSGGLLFEGRNVEGAKRSELLQYRSQVQMIFQDPFGSLNPVKTIRYHLARPLRIHKRETPGDIDKQVNALLEQVGLVPPEKYAEKYPHELSGGQRQRVAIARALAVSPKVLIADEPTSMLDVSIRVGILNLMVDLKQQHDLAFLYVTHDLASARYIADTVLVMYAGQIVEQGPAEQVLQEPLHPYTRLLLSAVPDPALGERDPIEIRKGLASAVDPPEGCRFADRCPLRIPICTELTPELVAPTPGHSARCHVTAPSSASREDTHVERVH